MQTIVLTLLSLVLTCLANPGMPAPWLAWVALVPLFFTAEKLPLWPRTLAFGLWGMLWWCWSVWWLVPAAIDFIDLAPWLALLVWLAICLALSAPYWLIGLLWQRAQVENRFLRSVVQALLFAVVVSLLASWIPASIASGQHVYAPLIQIVDLGGTPALLFVLVLVNLLLTQAVRFTPRQSHFLATALMVIVALAGYGQYRIAVTQRDNTTLLTVGYVQPNLARDDGIDHLLQQTRALARSEPDIDLIAWPEFPPAFSWSENAQDRARVNALLREIDKPLLLNSGYVYAAATVRNNGGPRPYYNAAQLISTQGNLLGSYYKQQLVPFFEYLPFESLSLQLRQYFPNSLNYVAGSSDQPLALNDDVRIAPLICYEMIFPAIATRQVNNGANIFINLTNDGWFGDSRGSISHLALAQFRAVEHHRPWIRVTNAGISAATDASGILLPLADIGLGERDTRTIKVNLPRQRSFYSRYPHAFTIGAGVVVLLALLCNRRRVRNELKTHPQR